MGLPKISESRFFPFLLILDIQWNSINLELLYTTYMQPELKTILLSKNEEVRQESINRGVNRCLHRLLNHTQFSSPTSTAPPMFHPVLPSHSLRSPNFTTHLVTPMLLCFLIPNIPSSNFMKANPFPQQVLCSRNQIQYQESRRKAIGKMWYKGIP